MKNVSTIQIAINELQARCDALKRAGLEQGSIQRISSGGYRLAWRDRLSGRVRFGQKLTPDQVEPLREAHKRYLLYQRLQKQIRNLEEQLAAIASLEASLAEEIDPQPIAQSA